MTTKRKQQIKRYRESSKGRAAISRYNRSAKRKAATLRYANTEAGLVKIKARKRLSNVMHKGRIKRQPCEVCGKQPAEAHHPDYSTPLAVKWLCLEHHRKEHAQ